MFRTLITITIILVCVSACDIIGMTARSCDPSVQSCPPIPCDPEVQTCVPKEKIIDIKEKPSCEYAPDGSWHCWGTSG